MLLDAVRASRRHATCLRVSSFKCFVSDVSSIEDDRNELRKIMNDEAEKVEAQAVDPGIPWNQQGVRRKFSAGMFIRPHYWSHEHRFEKERINVAYPLVGPEKRVARERDVLRHFGIDPLYETSNASLLSEFLTEMGKIRSRVTTRLTVKTQRRLGKAIRRAKMMGIIPQLSSPRIAARKL